MGQLSFWSADARPRALGDLEGLLCGPGRAELFGRGSLARLIVVLGPPPEPEPEEDEDGDEDGDGNAEHEAEHEEPDASPASTSRRFPRPRTTTPPPTWTSTTWPSSTSTPTSSLPVWGTRPLPGPPNPIPSLEKADFLALSASVDAGLAPTHPTPP